MSGNQEKSSSFLQGKPWLTLQKSNLRKNDKANICQAEAGSVLVNRTQHGLVLKMLIGHCSWDEIFGTAFGTCMILNYSFPNSAQMSFLRHTPLLAHSPGIMPPGVTPAHSHASSPPTQKE